MQPEGTVEVVIHLTGLKNRVMIIHPDNGPDGNRVVKARDVHYLKFYAYPDDILYIEDHLESMFPQRKRTLVGHHTHYYP